MAAKASLRTRSDSVCWVSFRGEQLESDSFLVPVFRSLFVPEGGHLRLLVSNETLVTL